MLGNQFVIWKHWLTFGLILTFLTSKTTAHQNSVDAEIQHLRRVLPQIEVHSILPGSTGEISVPDASCLRIGKLRGVQLQEKPPSLKQTPRYDKKNDIGQIKGSIPFIAKGIKPFRLSHFDCEFIYSGHHNGQMRDYASTHGFSTIYPYQTPKDSKNRHFPNGTTLLRAFGFNFDSWMKTNRIAKKRYDVFTQVDLESALIQQNAIPAPSGLFKKLMLDMEHTAYSPNQLRKQPWYPKPTAGQIYNDDFERRYYEGYGKTFIAAANVARRLGWSEVTIYGWSPFARTWGGVSKLGNPESNLHWDVFGQPLMASVDKVNCSVYCFYWSPKNVAYILANIDENQRLIQSSPIRKPLRPYFWGLLHGGGPGYRSWQEIPIPDEEQRAMIAAAFFTGVDGIVYWNASGYSNHHKPNYSNFRATNKLKKSLMVKSPFRMAKRPPETGPEIFNRYTALNVVEYNGQNDVIQFQRVGLKEQNRQAVLKAHPVYSTSFEMMKPFLRSRSEPVSATVEGLALIKMIELGLRTGKVMTDVSAQEQFDNDLPIIRRVKNGQYHYVFTYDPSIVHGGKPREITLQDFDGRDGLNLKFEADADSRIYILKEEPN